MERETSLVDARAIMGANIIGPEELLGFTDKTCFKNIDELKARIPVIPFEREILIKNAETFILILGIPFCKDGTPLSLIKMRSFFGIDPNVSEPCFYNQDWYLNEAFVNTCKIDFKWYLVKKALIKESRGQNPELILNNLNDFPTALLTAYTFFCWYFHTLGELLWQYDYIWCSDVDHNSDRVYTGRYIDKEGTNKNGFSIHRHLKLSEKYGAIEFR